MKSVIIILVGAFTLLMNMQNGFSQNQEKMFESVIVKWRAHYPLIALSGDFERWYFQTETRIAGSHHGLGLHGDYTTTSQAFAKENSKMDTWGAGIAYRFVAKEDYFVNSFYVHSALVFRGFNFEHTDPTLGVGALKTNGINLFINPGYQWVFFKNRLQVALGFGIDATYIFNDVLDFNGTERAIKEIDEIDGAPFFPVAPDMDVTIGWRF